MAASGVEKSSCCKVASASVSIAGEETMAAADASDADCCETAVVELHIRTLRRKNDETTTDVHRVDPFNVTSRLVVAPNRGRVSLLSPGDADSPVKVKRIKPFRTGSIIHLGTGVESDAGSKDSQTAAVVDVFAVELVEQIFHARGPQPLILPGVPAEVVNGEARRFDFFQAVGDAILVVDDAGQKFDAPPTLWRGIL